MFPRVTTVQAISSFVFMFVSRSGCSLTTGVCKLNQAAIGIDCHGLGDFLEGRAGFIVSVNKYGNSDVYSRGSVPCNLWSLADGRHYN